MLKNFAAVNEIEINLSSNITYLVGTNGSGKTSVGLNAIWTCFFGLAKTGKNVLHADRFRFIGKYGTKAVIKITLHDEKENIDITIQRTLTKTKTELKISASDDKKLPDDFIDNIFNIFSINPVGFAKISAQEQAKALGINTSKYDNLKQTAYNNRKELNYNFKRLQVRVANMQDIEKVEAVDIQKLLEKKDKIDKDNRLSFDKAFDDRNKKLQIAYKHNKKQEELKYSVMNMTKNIEIAEGNISVEKETFTEAENIYLAAKALFDKQTSEFKTAMKDHHKYHQDLINLRDNMPLPDDLLSTDIKIEITEQMNTDAITSQLQAAEQTNINAKQYKENLEIKAELEKATQAVKEKNDEMQQIENDKIAFIKSCDLPFDNITIDDKGGLLINDRPFSETYFSRGEILRMGIKLISKTNPALKYIFVPDARNLDDENREKLFTELVDAGFQVVAEIVDDKKQADHNSILLKESRVVASYDEAEGNNL